MMFALWLLSGAAFYVGCKWFLEGEPSRRIWTSIDLVLLLLAAVFGSIFIFLALVVLAIIFLAEYGDIELFRFGKKDD